VFFLRDIKKMFLKFPFGFDSCRNSGYMMSHFMYFSHYYILSSRVPYVVLDVSERQVTPSLSCGTACTSQFNIKMDLMEEG
jgi:hypothetical protein